MEAVRILKALDIKPRRTIRIGLWSGEEQGLLGSQGYVKKHFGSRPPMDDPAMKDMPTLLRREAGEVTVKPEQAKVSAYFNVDNGSGKIRGVHLQENEAVAPIFEAWMKPFKDLGMTTLTMRNTGGTDHLSFDAVGIPGFQFIQDPIEYETRTHHSNMDVYDRLQPDDLKQISVIVAGFVYDAAMRDQMLPRKPIEKGVPREPLGAAVAIFWGGCFLRALSGCFPGVLSRALLGRCRYSGRVVGSFLVRFQVGFQGAFQRAFK